MAPGHLTEDLTGEEHQVVPLGALGPQVGDEQGGGGGDGGPVGVVRGFVNNMGEEFDGEVGIDRIGDREPDALTQGGQGLGLIGLEEHVAGIGGGLEVLMGDEDVQHLPSQGPGLGATCQAYQGAGHLQPDIGDLAGAGLMARQVRQALAQGIEVGLEGGLFGGPVEDGIRRRVRQSRVVEIE